MGQRYHLMDEVRIGWREHWQRAQLVRALALLLAVLAVSLLAPFEAEAHRNQIHDHRPTMATVDQLSGVGTLKADSREGSATGYSGFGIGCTLAGLTVPGQVLPERNFPTGPAFRPSTMQAVLEVFRAPPSPPPNGGLRFQTD